MKQIILLFFLFFFTCFLIGCEITNLNNKSNSHELMISNTNQLIGITSSDIEKIYGHPYKCTYYINYNDLYKLNPKINIRDFNNIALFKYYYHFNDNNYMILLYKNNKVEKVSFDDNFSLNTYLENNTYITMDYFKISSSLNFKSIENSYKKYIGYDINDFIINNNLSYPKILVNSKNNSKSFYLYNLIVSGNKNYCLFIITIHNKISNFYIIESNKICETIIKFIS